jgi:hypothetical protein
VASLLVLVLVLVRICDMAHNLLTRTSTCLVFSSDFLEDVLT